MKIWGRFYGYFNRGWGAAQKGRSQTLKTHREKGKTVVFSREVLDGFRRTVGRYPAETGGMLGCSGDLRRVDVWCFDEKSQNTQASYSYDVEEMSVKFREWKANGYRATGFVHSHPQGCIRPSYDDIVTAWELMKFFRNEFFYLPVLMSSQDGRFTLYCYVIRKQGKSLRISLDDVLQAAEDSYLPVAFAPWERHCGIAQLEVAYARATAEPQPAAQEKTQPARPAQEAPQAPESAYFQRLEGMYPEAVLEKVVVCIGTGGARSYLENMARNGFRNYILMDGDIIAPSNVATQGVFRSEMGRYKTEAIADRIHDINPRARVLCVNRFLDNRMTDAEFRGYLDQFPGKKATDYLVLGCTDSFQGNTRSAVLSLQYGLPYIGAGMYREGLAAEAIFLYPGVTASCPRCLLRSRFEEYEKGYVNDVTSAGCTTFATERLNTLLGYLSLMLLLYHEAPGSPYHTMLDEVKDRNFLWIRLSPYLSSSALGIGLFDRVFQDPAVSQYTFMDETLWIPQHPDAPEYGEETCRLCGGIGDLRQLRHRWEDTRQVTPGIRAEEKSA